MATVTAVADLNRVQYIGLDFPTLFDDLRSELQTKFAADFNDFALSSMAIMLTDLTAYGLDSLAFYLDRRATDAYLDTAQTRKAVSRLTRQLGYKMGGAISSSTDLEVSLKTPVPFQVTIPKGFQFKGPNGLIFEAGEAVTIPAQSTGVYSVPVYEGQTFTETFTGDGTANQVYRLRRIPAGKYLVQNSAIVLVNGATFEERDFLPVTGGQYFEVGYNDDPATIRFGDGTYAQTDIPPQGASITVTYIAASGQVGQVTQNTITEVVNTLVVNFQAISLAVTNPEAAVGGADAESLDTAKANAGRVYKSRQVAITQSDYLALAGAYADPLYGRVAVAQAYSTRSAATDSALTLLLQNVRDLLAATYTSATTSRTQITGYAGTIASSALASAAAVAAIESAASTATASVEASLVNAQADIVSAQDTTQALGGGLSSVVSRIVLAGESAATSMTTAASTYTQPSIGSTVTVGLTAPYPSFNGLYVGQGVNLYASSGTVLVGTYTLTSITTSPVPAFTLQLVTPGTAYPTGSSIPASSALVPVASSLLSPTDKNFLTTVLADMTAQLSSLYSGTAGSLFDAQAELAAATTANTTVISSAALIPPLNTTIQTTATGATNSVTSAAATLQATLDEINPSGPTTNAVNVDLQAIYDHVDSILAADCSANLVTVPILARDADGFYAAPPYGLQQSLQSYLEARKAVTQSVVVTSGASSLVGAQVSVRVGVRPGFSENVVRLAVESAVNGLLKNRAFGVALYRSDIVTTVLAVSGVAFADPTISGPTAYLDGFGNLLIPESLIITKGSLTVTTEALF